MAEFFKKHARELGLRPSHYPLFCESCGEYIKNSEFSLTKLFNWFKSFPNLRKTKY